MNKGSSNGNAKSKKYYESFPVRRDNFVRTCKNQGWNFKDFEEIDSKEKCGRNIKYFYFEKEN